MFSTTLKCVTSNTERPLPRGPHHLAREDVLASQRGRMLDAMATVVAEKGYGPTTVADVIERAGVSRKTFYEHFRDKEECFLAAFDTGVEILLATVRDADPGGADPLERTRARVRAYLETLTAEPGFARTFVIELGAAGPRALQRRHEVLGEFTRLSREVGEELGMGAGVPEEAYLASVGATNELVAHALIEGKPLVELEDAIVYVNAALLTGFAT
jgi:AcrR family transcriptional regulator